MESLSNGRKTLLIVEDEAIIGLAEKRVLEGLGYAVRLAPSGEAAIAAVGEGDLDLILMDIDLGTGLDGPATAQEILKLRELPVVFLSSHSDKETVEKTERISSYGYVTKNSGPVVLDACIKMAFRLFKAQAEIRASQRELELTKTLLKGSFEQTPIPMALVSMPDQILRIANSAASRFLGIEDEPSYENRPLLEMHQSWREEDERGNLVPVTELPLAKAMQGISTLDREYVIVRKDGTRLWESVSGSAIYGEDGELIGAYIIFPDITERKKAEAELKESVARTEVLIKELQHRVKNNLMIVSSLLELESVSFEDELAKRAFQDARSRIDSMASLYERLSVSGDPERVEMGPYLRELSAAVFENYRAPGQKLSLSSEIEDLRFETALAVPLGLVANELIANSLRHAFPGGAAGRIMVRFAADGGGIALEVVDDGIGFEDEAGPRRPGLGLTLVQTLAEQMGGRISFGHGSAGGAGVALVVPPPPGAAPPGAEALSTSA